jgi:hypothetical protein
MQRYYKTIKSTFSYIVEYALMFINDERVSFTDSDSGVADKCH